MNTSQKIGERLLNGIVKENPTFVLMLGMCPTLAVTTCAINGLGMGATTLVVLALSNLIISLMRNIIPGKVRIPAFIVIIASFVTVVQLLLQAYLPFLNDALGVYIPLIVVNCIILGRAESYAYSNPPLPSLFDGIGMGLGFTLALTIIGSFRELLGAGTLFGFGVMPKSYTPIGIFVLAPGAFFVLAFLCALQNVLKKKLEKAGKDAGKIGSGCNEDCMHCPDQGCNRRFYDFAYEEGMPERKKTGHRRPGQDKEKNVSAEGSKAEAKMHGEKGKEDEAEKNGAEVQEADLPEKIDEKIKTDEKTKYDEEIKKDEKTKNDEEIKNDEKTKADASEIMIAEERKAESGEKREEKEKSSHGKKGKKKKHKKASVPEQKETGRAQEKAADTEKEHPEERTQEKTMDVETEHPVNREVEKAGDAEKEHPAKREEEKTVDAETEHPAKRAGEIQQEPERNIPDERDDLREPITEPKRNRLEVKDYTKVIDEMEILDLTEEDL